MRPVRAVPWMAGATSLDYAFDREREFSYGRRTKQQIIEHFSRFIATVWRIHPFREGNTRTAAVFAIKYLKELGFKVANNMFKENSWYFRNALARACYENPLKGVGKTFEPLERFFRNLLLGERHELKNRYLRVDLCKRQEAELKAGRRGAEQRSEKSGQKRAVRKGGQKTVERLCQLLKDRPCMAASRPTATTLPHPHRGRRELLPLLMNGQVKVA